MATVVSFVLCVISFCASFKNPSSCNYYDQSKLEAANHKALFVFGDSLFDPGNNQYLNGTTDEGTSATSWPYGQTFFNRPTGRLSDGRIVPDFIAQFAKLPILPPYLESGDHRLTDGANFASAGAGVLAGTHPGTIHIRMQLEYFKNLKMSLRQQLGDAEAEKTLRRAVYLFSIGGNDYFSFYSSNPDANESDQRAYVEMVTGNLTVVLKEVYNLGARKIAFQNAGPLGSVPVMKSMHPEVGSGCAEEPSALARLHNDYLAISLKNLESQLPGFKYAIFDYYNSLGDRVNDPSKYGFKEGKVACCGSGTFRGTGCGRRDGNETYELCSKPSEYVWFDGAHTTEMANRQLAELLWSGAPSITGPYNMEQLFGLS
ncbi:GDSL esterase/lipase 1 isoform X2 [Ricinus communis]|uniref:GDSL esterase/lipase 1 isoform X2 n=1 Tax=Ricinus communis TaxID=3988 RepID=UPI00201AD6A5|nr:GDSL esterase/lipase 1 isoform X2 [Ricinus communis]